MNYQLFFLLGKVFYPYGYLDDLGKLIEALLPKTKNFYSHLNKKDLTDADCWPVKRDFRDI